MGEKNKYLDSRDMDIPQAFVDKTIVPNFFKAPSEVKKEIKPAEKKIEGPEKQRFEKDMAVKIPGRNEIWLIRSFEGDYAYVQTPSEIDLQKILLSELEMVPEKE